MDNGILRLIVHTCLFFIPIAGIVILLTKEFIKEIKKRKNAGSEDFKSKYKIGKLFIFAILIIYGLFLELLLVNSLWLDLFKFPKVVGIMGIILFVPYLICIFIIVYALGPAIVFSNVSANRMFRHIGGKKNNFEKKQDPESS